jgi:hypothetical protein
MTADLAMSPPDTSQDNPPEPVYPGVEDWVSGHFLPIYRRPIGGEFRWCRQWWRHAEAIMRLTALWQSWEAMRLQPGTGIANWLRDHLDHQLPILLGRVGPFAQCSPDEHVEPRPATTEPPPPDWWDPADIPQDPGDAQPLLRPAPIPTASPYSEQPPHDGPPETGHEST